MIRYRPWSQNGSLPNLLANTQISYPSSRSLRTLLFCRAGCRKAAVEPCQLALHPPPPIRYNASLCTTTRWSAQLPEPDRIYWLVFDSVGPGVCRMLQTNFGEFHFHTLG